MIAPSSIRSLLHLVATVICLFLVTGCGGGFSPPPPPLPPDLTPVGDGLKVLAFSMIGVAIVFTLGRLLK